MLSYVKKLHRHFVLYCISIIAMIIMDIFFIIIILQHSCAPYINVDYISSLLKVHSFSLLLSCLLSIAVWSNIW